MQAPYIPKQDDELPNSWKADIFFHDKSNIQLDIAEHHLSDKLYEVMTSSDEILWIPLTSIKMIKFDKDFSKIIELKRKSQKQAG